MDGIGGLPSNFFAPMMFYGSRLPTRMLLRRLSLVAVLATAGLAAAPAAPTARAAGPADAPYRPGEVVVRYADGTNGTERAAVQRETGTGTAEAVTGDTKLLAIRDGASVASTVQELRHQPGVASATPNYIAKASAYLPRDPGDAGLPGGWQTLQWNFLPGMGVDAPDAWSHLIAAGRPGGLGVTVAVLDTGVAYENRGRFRRSPDFKARRFVRGYDFVDNDRWPDDLNGHGTHVAGTIAESTGNSIGVTGLAYGVNLMPVRVLDRSGEGDSVAISAGIRWAASHGARVINLSFEFGPAVTSRQIPDILAALRYARRKGVLVVGAAGNAAARAVAYPARSSAVLAVGATTEHGCQADYSNGGSDLDLVAPGGGPDATIDGDPNCRPLDSEGGDIYQETFEGSPRSFGLPSGYVGTSMAAPHVTATAALIIASGVIGRRPTPHALALRLQGTATDLGAPGRDSHYGWGLVNAARATDPSIP